MRQKTALSEPVEIFVSWSGRQAQQVAEAMCALLKELFPKHVKTWYSNADISKGTRWNVELAEALDRCSFGLICITRANRTSPWLLFEAGAIAKAVEESRIFPFLLDLNQSELIGPLAQFQATLPNRKDVALLIHEINKCLQRPKRRNNIDQLYIHAWKSFAARLRQIKKNGHIREITPQIRAELHEAVESYKTYEDFYALFKDIRPKSQRRKKTQSLTKET